MPGMNGIELSKRMSKICPAIKTLFISGYLDEMTMRDEIKEAYIHKPITLGDLSHKLREVLDRK